MKVSKSKYNIWLALLLIVSILSTSSAVSATEPKSSASSFAKIKPEDITRCELFYMQWNKLSRYNITPERVRNTNWDVKTEFRNKSKWCPIPNFDELQVSPVIVKSAEIDCRLVVVFYADNNEVLQVAFAKNKPVVMINNEAFIGSKDLFDSITSYLPCDIQHDLQNMTQLYKSDPKK
jgi:hypothetical protein